MAQHQSPGLVDDTDGSPAEAAVRLSIDGAHYELHLSRANRNALLRDVARFIAAARPVGSAHRQRTAADPQAVRRWARSHGIRVPASGRLPREVVDRFHAAGN